MRVTLADLAHRHRGVLKALGVLCALGGLFLVGAATRPPPALAFVATPMTDAGSGQALPSSQTLPGEPSRPPVVASSNATVTAPASPASPASTSSGAGLAAGVSADAGTAPVILNTATAQDLRRLPGIGPKRAEAILALRTRLGRFRSIDELLRVKGLGRKTLQRLRPLLRVDPPPE